jgi:F-type H+-transporting ATPase subunit b
MTSTRILFLAGTFLLATPGLVAAAESEGGFSVFSVNPGLSVWTTVVFLMLLGILWKFAWGPILGAVEAREDRIQSALDESRERQEEARKLLAEHKAQLNDARRQANEILAEARAAGDRLRKDLEEKARGEARGIIESARKEIERERDQALADIRKESVDLALAAAARLLGERVDAEKDREMVVGFLDDMKDGAETGGARA